MLDDFCGLIVHFKGLVELGLCLLCLLVGRQLLLDLLVDFLEDVLDAFEFATVLLLLREHS